MAKTGTTQVGNTAVTSRGKRTMRKEVRAIVKPWKELRGERQLELWPFIMKLLRRWQSPDVSLRDIEQALREWTRQRAAGSVKEKDLPTWYEGELCLCQKLHEYPVAIVEEVIEEWQTVLRTGKRDLRELAAMKKEILAFFRKNLTDRERCLLETVAFHWGRSHLTEFWDEIHQSFDEPWTLEEKGASLESDPDLAVLVRAHRLGRSAYRGYAQSS